MNETEFHALADATLTTLCDILEEADAEGLLDVECTGGILTIVRPDKKQWIVSKHAPSRQLWLASPISGGLHFSHDGEWKLPDGRELRSLLSQELGVVL